MINMQIKSKQSILSKKTYQNLIDKFNYLEISDQARSHLVSLVLEGFEAFQKIYNKKIPKLLKQNIKNLDKITEILYSLEVEYVHLGWHMNDAKKAFKELEKSLSKKNNNLRKARPIITRDKIISMIEKCLNKKIPIQQLINWSFTHWDDRYESGYSKAISLVMGNLGGARFHESSRKSFSKLGIKLEKTNFTVKDFRAMIKQLK